MNSTHWITIAFVAGVAAGFFVTTLSPSGSWQYNNLYVAGMNAGS
jgi:hypothetical protein